jgi:hypothetical protein
MLEYENASAATDIRFERVGDVLTIKLPKGGFVRGGATLLRSWQFAIFLAVLLLAVNLVPALSWCSAALGGNVRPLRITSGSVTTFFLQPAIMVCVYLAVVSQNATTIRLYRTELIRTAYGILGTARETAYDRCEIAAVRVGWLDVSIVSPRSRRFGICHGTVLFTGRSREERERVAAAIRAWLDERPTRL